MTRKLTKKKEYVVGTRHEGREQIINKYCKVGMPVYLVREPNNLHDKNAIQVFIETKGFFSKKRRQIGYINKEFAEIAALLMDGGAEVTGEIYRMFLGCSDFGEIEVGIDLRFHYS
jgi:hypothetical protein